MKLSTIGTSAICQRALDSIADLEGIEIIAAYSRDMNKAKAFQEKNGFLKAFDNLEDLFSDPDTDTIYIASPNALHYPQAKAALEHGKNVILEKPFASTLEQAQDLFETAEKNGVMIFEAITNIHTPNFGLLKDSLPRAGQIKQAFLNFSHNSQAHKHLKEGIVDNVLDMKMDGGALVDVNVYNLHLANALWGKPQSITYHPNLGWNGIDTSGMVFMQYPGFFVMAVASKDSASRYNTYIAGDQGTFFIKNGSTGRMNHVIFESSIPEEQPAEKEVISIDQGPHMSYEFMDALVALQEDNKEMYEDYKKQTLEVMDMLETCKKQRDDLFQACQNPESPAKDLH